MRALVATTTFARRIPRGWVIFSAAAMAWAVIALPWVLLG